MLDARRRAVLDAIGIEMWRSRHPVSAAAMDEPSLHQVVESGHGASAGRAVAGPEPLADDRVRVADGRPSVSPPLDATENVAGLDWEALRATVASCTACALHATRAQAVFGVGNQDARLMVIGEAPGADEDRKGEPFVGRAGQLLNAMLAAIGYPRETVYIANIIKCRPPGNRDPHVEEAAACRVYLLRQIELIKPQLILCVGRISAHNLLGTEEPVGRLRGSVHRFDPGDIPVLVTYHPAYLLRQPQEKAKAWQDLQAAWRLLKSA